MELEAALRTIHGDTWWRPATLGYMVMLSLSTNLPTALQGMAIVFMGEIPEHQCNYTSENISESSNGALATQCSVSQNNSNVSEECSTGWLYYPEPPEQQNVVMEWDLVCGRRIQTDLSQMLRESGFLFATLISPISDRFGRRNVHIVGNLLITVLGVTVAFSPSFWVFAVLRFLVAVVDYVSFFAGSVLLFEMYDCHRRLAVAVVGCVAFTLSSLLLVLLAFLLPNWRHMQLALAACSAVWIIYIWILPESPTWLLDRGRKKQAEQSLRMVAKGNGFKGSKLQIHLNDVSRIEITTNKPTAEQQLLEKLPLKKGVVVVKEKPAADKEDSNSLSLLDLLKVNILRKHLVICSLLHFNFVLVYMGLMFSTTAFSGNKYLNYMTGSLLELPSLVIVLLACQRWGRRWTICLTHIFAGLSLAVLTVAEFFLAEGSLRTVLTVGGAVLGRGALCGCYPAILVYKAEVFPTVLRGGSMGISSILAALASCLSPLAAFTAKSILWAPMFVFSVLTLVTGLTTLLLPETAGKPLPNTISEVRQLYLPTQPTKHTSSAATEDADVTKDMLDHVSNPTI